MQRRRDITVTVERDEALGCWWVQADEGAGHPEVGLLPPFADQGCAETAASTLRLAYRMDGATVPDPTTEA